MAASTDHAIVDVVVGLVANAAGELLIAKRPQEKHCGGYWEFPGGKVEAGEAEFSALKRELYEECGIVIQTAAKAIEVTHTYPTKTVRLLVWQVTAFDGEATGREQQIIHWCQPAQLTQYDFPPANQAILDFVRRCEF